MSVLDGCRQVLAHFGVDETQYQIGRTRWVSPNTALLKAAAQVGGTGIPWRPSAAHHTARLTDQAADRLPARLFFRAGVLGHLEDAAARMQRAALFIQSTWRMARCRRVFLAARTAAVTVQAHWRGRQGRLLFAELLRRHRAAACIQAAARACAQRRRYRRALAGVVAIQVGLE